MDKKIIAIPSALPGGLDAGMGMHFGHCEIYTIAEVEDGKVASDPPSAGRLPRPGELSGRRRRQRAAGGRHGHASPHGLQSGGRGSVLRGELPHRGTIRAGLHRGQAARVHARTLLRRALERFAVESPCGRAPLPVCAKHFTDKAGRNESRLARRRGTFQS